MKATVLKSTGSWYQVQTDDGKVHAARVRGKLRLEEIKETNPVAVGDYVELELEGNEAVIVALHPRENYIVRQSVKKTGHTHVIAANIDQALLVVTLSRPRTSAGFVDRFTVAAESFRIPQVLVFNKQDLWDEDEKEEVNQLIDLYSSFGVRCITTSAAIEPQDEVKHVLANKKTLIAGLSGAGKSTLLNKLSPGIRQRTSEVSDVTSKGIHTTTFAEMFLIGESTFVIDTPGIKELGLVDMKPEEVSDYFAEMRDIRTSCKYGAKCLHLSEPQCAVKAALQTGQISESRYASYVRIISGEDNRK